MYILLLLPTVIIIHKKQHNNGVVDRGKRIFALREILFDTGITWTTLVPKRSIGEKLNISIPTSYLLSVIQAL